MIVLLIMTSMVVNLLRVRTKIEVALLTPKRRVRRVAAKVNGLSVCGGIVSPADLLLKGSEELCAMENTYQISLETSHEGDRLLV